MLSSRVAARTTTTAVAGRPRSSSLRSLSVLSSHNNHPLFKSTTTPRGNAVLNNVLPRNNNQQQQQQRTLVGLVHAIDKRVYRWAKGVLPPISKTENIALGCGTIGEFVFCYGHDTNILGGFVFVFRSKSGGLFFEPRRDTVSIWISLLPFGCLACWHVGILSGSLEFFDERKFDRPGVEIY